jgi:drug/metabolite transporter (DMT)-like permease
VIPANLLEVQLAPLPVDHKMGLSISAIGGLALSFDIPMVRLTNGDVWSVQFLRSVLLVAMAFFIWTIARTVFGKRQAFVPGKSGWVVLALYGASTVLFFYSVFETSTANLVFILAFNPMFGALFGWLIMRERPRWKTFLAMIVMACGVFIIVQAGLSAGHVLGDLAALGAAVLISLAIVLSRASGRDMGYVSLLSAIIPAIVSGWFVLQQGGIQTEFPGWIVLNGTVLMPIAFFFLALAPSYIPGAQVGMFYLLETILAPVWVWLIFNEIPTSQTVTGGAILLAALIAHSLWELNEDRRSRLAAPA